MPLSDPIGDLLTRIRNAQSAGQSKTEVPTSKLKTAVLEVLKREGYIRGFYDTEAAGRITTTVELKEQGTIKRIVRVSTPGRRVYAQIKTLPKVANGLGISILSTPRGVMSDNEARVAHVGGEVLCHVF
jgi:small subunit ribosomal protein S8